MSMVNKDYQSFLEYGIDQIEDRTTGGSFLASTNSSAWESGDI